MTPPRRNHRIARLVAFVAVVAFLVASCGDSDSEATDTPATPVDPSEATTENEADDPDDPGNPGDTQDSSDSPASSSDEIDLTKLSESEQLAAVAMQTVFSQPSEAWPGFDPAHFPVVVVLTDDDDNFESALLLHHPAPDALGPAALVAGVDGLDSLYHVVNPTGLAMPENEVFDFDVDVGGVPSYVVLSRGPNGTPLNVGGLNLTEYIQTGSLGWRSLALHEMFHLYQLESWEEPFADQSLYDFEVENFELSFLEDQALVAAYNSSGDDETVAIRHFLALRATRLEKFATTALDESQELSEGTAQWVEWRTVRPDDNPWVDPVLGDLSDTEAFTETVLTFGPGPVSGPDLSRFYLTGAVQMELLDRSGVDWREPIETGTSMSALLRTVVDVEPGDYEALVAEARATYDADGSFVAIAQRWVDAAPAAEGGSQTDGTGPEGGELGLDEETTACLAEYGFDLEALAETEGELTVSDEAAAACF